MTSSLPERSSSVPAALHWASRPWTQVPDWPPATTRSQSPSRLLARPCRALPRSPPVQPSARRTTSSTCRLTALRRASRLPPAPTHRRNWPKRSSRPRGAVSPRPSPRPASSPSRRLSRVLPHRCRSPVDQRSLRWDCRPALPWPARTASSAVDGTSTTVSDIAGSGTTSVVLNSGTGGTVTLGITGGTQRGVHDGGQHLRRRRLSEFGRLGHQQCRCRCDGQRTPGRGPTAMPSSSRPTERERVRPPRWTPRRSPAPGSGPSSRPRQPRTPWCQWAARGDIR